jgi:hypothetical protein
MGKNLAKSLVKHLAINLKIEKKNRKKLSKFFSINLEKNTNNFELSVKYLPMYVGTYIHIFCWRCSQVIANSQ